VQMMCACRHGLYKNGQHPSGFSIERHLEDDDNDTKCVWDGQS
jgi:hypothetical protein